MKKDKYIRIRLTGDEDEVIRKQAKDAGKTLTEYIIGLVITKDIVITDVITKPSVPAKLEKEHSKALASVSELREKYLGTPTQTEGRIESKQELLTAENLVKEAKSAPTGEWKNINTVKKELNKQLKSTGSNLVATVETYGENEHTIEDVPTKVKFVLCSSCDEPSKDKYCVACQEKYALSPDGSSAVPIKNVVSNMDRVVQVMEGRIEPKKKEQELYYVEGFRDPVRIKKERAKLKKIVPVMKDNIDNDYVSRKPSKSRVIEGLIHTCTACSTPIKKGFLCADCLK